MQLTDIKIDNIVDGIIPNQNVTIVSIKIISSDVADISYRDQSGNIGNQLVYAHQLDNIKIVNDLRLYDVKLHLGHASVTTTEQYSNMNLKRVAQDFPDLKRPSTVMSKMAMEDTVLEGIQGDVSNYLT